MRKIASYRLHPKDNTEGKYELTVSMGYDISGKKIRKTKIIKINPNLSEKRKTKLLEVECAKYEEEIKNGVAGKDDIKFIDFTLNEWKPNYADKNLALTTVTRYMEFLESRIFPAIGHLKLKDITPQVLNKFYNYLATPEASKKVKKDKNGKVISREPLAPRMQLHHHRVISAILEKAVKWQFLKENPARRAEPPKVPRKEQIYLDEKQTKELISLLEKAEQPYKTFCLLTLWTGARRGEICGLEWKDIDLKEKTLKIERTSQLVKGTGLITKTTKTEQSKRIVDLNDYCVKLLKSYKIWQMERKLRLGDIWTHETDRLFTQDNRIANFTRYFYYMV